MKNRSVFFSIFILASLLATTLGMVFPTTALAMGSHAPGDTALTQAFNAEQRWLDVQQQYIQKAEAVSAQMQQLIDTASAAGLDVLALKNALASYNNQLGPVKSQHQSAASLLATHNGFGNDGSVSNRLAARQTVLDARQALFGAHIDLIQAVHNLRQAVRDWRAAVIPQG